ncbi:hypothetical protein UA08_02061 [Talaromyces atroroseus]|uniref:Uncharacterized protein n=1 Tax=Talaromyces atroroseus TaxID=1441469 RepID=A0A1Q5QAK3_TALAT|nr:hypothetical protein UA08_02061 [Talaromyces atroroseus]OKL62973.1 hypothetical protein UA08_02061 [Talaromyces atroroseus]
MSGISTSGIIVIVVVVSGLLVAIFWSFSAHYSRGSTMADATHQISHEQDAYMRQVRQRTHQHAYAESLSAIGDGATTTRTSQVWSNTHNGGAATSPNTPMTPVAVAVAGSRRMSNQNPYFPREKDGSRVNYSAYDEQADYYEEQSPYGNNTYNEYGYEQQQQQPLPQQSDEKAQPIQPHQQV